MGSYGTPVTSRQTAAAVVCETAAYLFWITYSPSAETSLVEVADNDTAGDGADTVVWDISDTAAAEEQPHHVVFNPPIPFVYGIKLVTATDVTSAIFCYAPKF